MSKEAQTWEEALKARVIKQKLEAQGLSAGPRIISFQGGRLSIDKIPAPNDTTVGIILAFCKENTFYDGAWDPDQPKAPDCYAVYGHGDIMKPSDFARDPQSELCDKCPQFQWGSKGKGKACKEVVRIAVLEGAIGSPMEVEASILRYAKIPVTSVKNFMSYYSTLASRDLATFQVLTEISTAPNPKTTFQVNFKPVGKITDGEIMSALLNRVDLAEQGIRYEYDMNKEEPEAPVKKAKFST